MDTSVPPQENKDEAGSADIPHIMVCYFKLNPHGQGTISQMSEFLRDLEMNSCVDERAIPRDAFVIGMTAYYMDIMAAKAKAKAEAEGKAEDAARVCADDTLVASVNLITDSIYGNNTEVPLSSMMDKLRGLKKSFGTSAHPANYVVPPMHPTHLSIIVNRDDDDGVMEGFVEHFTERMKSSFPNTRTVLVFTKELPLVAVNESVTEAMRAIDSDPRMLIKSQEAWVSILKNPRRLHPMYIHFMTHARSLSMVKNVGVSCVGTRCTPSSRPMSLVTVPLDHMVSQCALP